MQCVLSNITLCLLEYHHYLLSFSVSRPLFKPLPPKEKEVEICWRCNTLSERGIDWFGVAVVMHSVVLAVHVVVLVVHSVVMVHLLPCRCLSAA